MLKNTFFEENSERLLLKKQPNRYVNARKMYKRHADLDALSTSICGTMTEPIKTPNFEGSDKYLIWSNDAILGIVSSAFNAV